MRNICIFKGKTLDDARCVETTLIDGMMPIKTIDRIRKDHDETFYHLYFITLVRKCNIGTLLYDACNDCIAI